ncbi:DNA polymerase III subunit gamma/tau [Poriferisphaera sp. WC338]|uniref:DNA polymerase III subunit gamma/tau n=1 Tax=Poriferisphaera sp. WC338 TaxID=3425129 RepID=UPI003D81614C
MAYTVLARRYRSQAFDQVVGQQPIAQTLKNAISQKRVAHAYLFSGTRGVGKTSMARIFARALNAPDTISDAPKQPDLEYPPTDVQERMAEAIMHGEDLNVIEIDGASNRGVDEARQLIANAGLAPTANANYKIYIIDEVHMLTREAFNALLKTMEEPPEHVKFILCTTEPHKVPPTIQSRCQRFDFRNIPTVQIAEHIGSVLGNEKIEAEQQVLWQVARLGNGSMRDALSLLDRLIATGQSPLTVQTLEEMFGLPAAERIKQLVDAIAMTDIKQSLESAHALLTTGISQEQLIDVLIERFRQLMLIAACGPESDLVELSEEAKQEAAEQAKRFDAPAITYMIALCENLQRTGKASANPRALFDVTIVRLALAEKYADISQLLAGNPTAQKKNINPPSSNLSLAPAIGNTPAAVAPTAIRSAAVTHTPSSTRPGLTSNPTHTAPTPSAAATIAPLQNIDVTDTKAVWSAVRSRLDDKPALAWIKNLSLQALTETTAILVLVDGSPDLSGFLVPQRLESLALEFVAILGRRIQVEIDHSAVSASSKSQSKSQVTPQRALSQEQIDLAKNLPLVKKVLETFPEAMLVGVADEQADLALDSPTEMTDETMSDTLDSDQDD